MDERGDSAAGSGLEAGFRLEGLDVDPLAGEVAGAGGREKLDPKVMDTLVVLAEDAGRVVLRDTLMARLWPDTVVTDESLSRCIYELRRQLSLAGGDERFKAMIETVPKRGYRLRGTVERPSTPAPAEADSIPDIAPAPAAGRGRRALLVLAAVAAVALLLWLVLGRQTAETPAAPPAHGYSLAVLPLDDLSDAQDQAHFSEGVAEEIINRLANTKTLRVISRKSSFSFRGEDTGIADIARRLNVTHVLEGSIRKSGNRVRITARLVDAASNSQVWSKTYDQELTSLFAVQDQIAESVATSLNATLAGHPEHVPGIEAHNLFLQGELFYNRRAPGDVERAIRYYRDALAVDPAYARAWASLAGAYSLLAYHGGMSRPEALARQGEAARKAIDLDPKLAVAYARLAQYFWDIGDRPSSYRIFDQAKALDPDDLLVLTFAAGIAMRAGKVDEAIAHYDRIVALDPRSAANHANRGIYLQAANRFEEAKAELASARELNPELGDEFDLATVRILVFQDRLDDARKVAARLPEGRILDHALALLYHAEGREPEADAALARLAGSPVKPVDVRLAEVYAYRGKSDDAFRALSGVAEAIMRNEGAEASRLWSWQVEMRVSPFLRTLHDDPRWQKLMVEPLAVNS
jgi:TolB-like protein/DNA-binding winged helix-turn-helix (wHTH) protein/Tfp pilus assembly protein PilF